MREEEGGEVNCNCKQPHPGSDEANDKGCLCAVMDNGYGRGYMGIDGHQISKVTGREYGWMVSGNCPLHGETT